MSESNAVADALLPIDQIETPEPQQPDVTQLERRTAQADPQPEKPQTDQTEGEPSARTLVSGRKPKTRRKGRVMVGRTTCTKCNKILAYCSVKPHMNSYHPTDPRHVYPCGVTGCEQVFYTRAVRYKHLVKNHQHFPKKRNPPVDIYQRSPLPSVHMKGTRYCHDCRKTWPNREKFLRHKKRCVPVPSPPPHPAEPDHEAHLPQLPVNPVRGLSVKRVTAAKSRRRKGAGKKVLQSDGEYHSLSLYPMLKAELVYNGWCVSCT